ncbi:NAD(P)/FAD-dependent oxidoreductase [Ponticoccus litoralis]|uniref:FAD-dependent oxidoreductase n=1 Tax=Ponticoccus litoralis TaxID=422297 RepID=A0AAW9S7C2_9RHOB
MSGPRIVVIGGGIAGISAGAALASDAQVTVLETEPQPGYHSTGRSAALYIRNYGNAVLRVLNATAGPALEGGLLGESVLGPRGALMLAGPEEMAALEDYAAGSSGLERMTAREAAEIVPILRVERIEAVVLERDAQDIDVDRLLQGCLRLMRQRGGTLMTGAPVTALARDGAGWRIEAGGEVLTADIVVNAAGAWADRVAALAGLPPVGLVPKRRSAVLMAVPNPAEEVGRWPLFGSVADTWYAKPDGGRLMISPADEDPVEPGDAWPDDMVLAEGLDRFSQMVDVPLVRPSHSWAGLRSFVADKTPVVGMDPLAPGFFWLAGQGGYGVQTAPALAALTAALCLGGRPALDADTLAALSPERFARG